MSIASGLLGYIGGSAAGATWVFDNLIADTPLSKALKETFGTNNINKKILSLAYFLNISDSNVTSRYEVFADTHRLPWQKTMTASAICRLFQNITSDKIDQFMSKLSSFTKLRDDNNKTEYYALDSTSISTYSQNLSKAEYGHNKAGDKIIPANVGVVLISETGATTAAISISDVAGNPKSSDLTGTTTIRNIEGEQSNYLVLGRKTGDTNKVGFYQPTGTQIPANRAYIYLEGGNVQGLAFNFDGATTDINSISATTDKQEIYDLSGRRVMKANKGLYIINGKKCFIK